MFEPKKGLGQGQNVPPVLFLYMGLHFTITLLCTPMFSQPLLTLLLCLGLGLGLGLVLVLVVRYAVLRVFSVACPHMLLLALYCVHNAGDYCPVDKSRDRRRNGSRFRT